VTPRRTWSSSLVEAADAVLANIPDQAALEKILHAARSALAAKSAMLLCEAEGGSSLLVVAVAGAGPNVGAPFEAETGIWGRAFRQGRPQQAVRGTRLVAGTCGWHTTAPALAVPVIAGGQPIGVLSVEGSSSAQRWDQPMIELLQAFAGYAGAVLQARLAAGQLASAGKTFRSYFRALPIAGLIQVAGVGTIIDVNEEFCALVGYQREECVGRRAMDLGLWVDRAARDRRVQELLERGSLRHWEVEFRKKNGETGFVLMSLHQMEIGGKQCVIAGMIDITDRRRDQVRLAHEATHDLLTGLGNRGFFRDRLVHALNSDRKLALLVMDLDRFKEVNDTFGHAVGDELLRQVGERLKKIFPATAALARLGGDEFAALTTRADGEAAVGLAEAVGKSFESPFRLGEIEVSVGASIGITTASQGAMDADALHRQADIAMYAAKHLDRVWMIYDESQDRYSPLRLQMISELRRGISLQQLLLHHQPIIDLRSHLVVGAEALVRWQHPVRGLLDAAVFVPLAEETGLMREITEFVLGAGIAQCRRWNQAGYALGIAVNLSSRNIADPKLPGLIASLVRDTEFPTERIIFEVSERIIATEPERCAQVLTALRSLGVSVAVDDVGTGLAAAGYLSAISIDYAKLDGTLVRGINSNHRMRVIVRKTIEMLHDLGLRVVAEGVEDQPTLDLLVEFACDYAQGFYLGAPMSEENLASLKLSEAPPDKKRVS
jgi:diguanylate cyclase (GGDEF)-like protein/PAS domain S-box-containing protein